MSKTARTPYKTKKKERKDVRAARAVKNSVSDVAEHFGSVEEQQSGWTQSSRRVTSWRCRSPGGVRIAPNKQFCLHPSLECRQRWRRSDIGRQTVPHARPLPLETRGLRLLTGVSQARRVCSLMPSEETTGRRGPLHTRGRWQGTTEPGR